MAPDVPRSRLRPMHVIALAVVASASALLVVRYLGAVSNAVQNEQTSACLALQPQAVDRAAPDFNLPDLQGKKHKLSRHRGKVVLLNFWATWCPPCVEELPSIADLQRSMSTRSSEFSLVTVSVDDSADVVTKFMGQHRSLFGSIPVLMDPSRKVAAAFGTSKFPETYLIDRSGTVRYRFVNKRDWSSPTAAACVDSLM